MFLVKEAKYVSLTREFTPTTQSKSIPHYESSYYGSKTRIYDSNANLYQLADGPICFTALINLGGFHGNEAGRGHMSAPITSYMNFLEGAWNFKGGVLIRIIEHCYQLKGASVRK